MKKRLLKASTKYIIIFSVLLAYLIWILLTDIKLPCMIYQLTGYQCPGCGITRMFLSLLEFDFKSAFNHNPFLFIVIPLNLFCILYLEINYILKGKYRFGIIKYFLYLEVVGFILFGILRNVIWFVSYVRFTLQRNNS